LPIETWELSAYLIEASYLNADIYLHRQDDCGEFLVFPLAFVSFSLIEYKTQSLCSSPRAADTGFSFGNFNQVNCDNLIKRKHFDE